MRLLLAALLLVLGAATAARAQEPAWPTRPITMVVAYPPGAITDTVGRRVAERLGAALGTQVVVENRGGAGGNVAAAYVARAPADGYTLLFTSYGNLIIAAAAELPLGFQPWRDLVPVAMIGPMTVVLLVRPGGPYQDLQGFVRHVAANPGKVNFASVGVGSSYHLLIEQMIAYGKLSMTHVPYRGGAAAMTDFLGGRVDATLATLLFARPYLNDSRARAIAVANGERSPVLPEVPTVGEAVPGAKLTDGLAVLAPTGVPAPVIARLNAAIRTIIAVPAMRDWLTNEGVTPRPGPPEAFTAEMLPATEELRALLRQANIRVE
jgi:tripartite-type tricarboxylate transporter receptor subunit TctC